jgi:hypothetical protein
MGSPPVMSQIAFFGAGGMTMCASNLCEEPVQVTLVSTATAVGAGLIGAMLDAVTPPKIKPVLGLGIVLYAGAVMCRRIRRIHRRRLAPPQRPPRKMIEIDGGYPAASISFGPIVEEPN